MTRDRHNSLNNPSDQDFVKQKLKQIKEEKKLGNEVKAQRHANELFNWLGWD